MTIWERLFGVSRTLARQNECFMLRYQRETGLYDTFPYPRINGGGDGTLPLLDAPVVVPGNLLDAQPNIFRDGGELAAELFFTQTYNPNLPKEE